jgi:hypothetical protein
MKNILSILLISLVIISCETILEEVPANRLPELKEKLVLTSFISPQDTSVNVKVTISSPLFGDYKSQYTGFSIINGDTTYSGKSNNITDAVVTLSTGNQSVAIPYNSKLQYYTIPISRFKIEAGKTYILKAKSKNLEVEASTTVPLENIKIENFKIDSVGRINTFQKDTSRGYEVSFNWRDIAGKQNFYRTKGNWDYLMEYPRIKRVNNQEVVEYEARNQNSIFRWDNDSSPLKSYINDEKSDGKTIDSPNGFVYESKSYSSTNGSKLYPSRIKKGVSTLQIELLNISKEYYDYATSLAKSNEASDNPFAEPVPIYTNVKNGLGCFAGFNQSVLVLKVK